LSSVNFGGGNEFGALRTYLSAKRKRRREDMVDRLTKKLGGDAKVWVAGSKKLRSNATAKIKKNKQARGGGAEPADWESGNWTEKMERRTSIFFHKEGGGG